MITGCTKGCTHPHTHRSRPHSGEKTAVRGPIRANSTLKGGKKMMEFDEDLTEKAKSDLLYLEQLNSYAENTKNTPEYIRAMAMYTQALHVIEERYGNLEHHIYRSK